MNDQAIPAVSIVVPVYNAEKYLERCLESILSQSLSSIEVIVINDGSTDGSQKIIQRYADEYPKIIKAIEKPNEGVSKTRNMSFDIIRGEYLVFVDSDDYLNKDYLEQLYGTAKEKKRDMVVCGQYKVSESGEILDTMAYPVHGKGQCILRKLNMAGKIYKRSYLEKYHIRFPEGKIYEDNVFNLMALFLAKDFIALEYCGYNQVVHKGSITSRKIEDVKIPYREIENALDFLLQRKEKINDRSILEFTLLSFLTYFIFFANKKHAYMELENRKSDMAIVDHLCEYSCELLNKYFPGYWKNKHVGILKKNNLILKQKLGVKAFSFLCRTKLLKPFAHLYYSI